METQNRSYFRYSLIGMNMTCTVGNAQASASTSQINTANETQITTKSEARQTAMHAAILLGLLLAMFSGGGWFEPLQAL